MDGSPVRGIDSAVVEEFSEVDGDFFPLLRRRLHTTIHRHHRRRREGSRGRPI